MLLGREELVAGLLQSQLEYRRLERGATWAKENAIENAFYYCYHIGEFNKKYPNAQIKPLPAVDSK